MARAAPMAMALVLALAWMLPLAWWSLVASGAMLTAICAIAVWPARSTQSVARPIRAAVASSLSLWLIGAIAAVYAFRALAYPHGDAFSRLGYPFLVQTALALPGGALLLVLIGVVALTPFVLVSD